VVIRDESLDLVEVGEVFKDAVLEHRVELMLKAGQHGRRLETVHAALLEGGVPVEGVQVEESECVQNFAHARMHLGYLQVLVHVQRALTGQLLRNTVEPRVCALKSKQG
jgi:hypothetical protein